MIRNIGTLKAPFFALAISLGIADVTNLIGKLTTVTLARKYYADFIRSIDPPIATISSINGWLGVLNFK